MSFEKRPQATAIFETSTPLDISEGSVTLDSGTVPYGLADIDVPLLDEAIVEDLDPYANQRILITASAAMDGSDEREFDLVMTGRTVSHDKRNVAIELATDEAILQRHADITDDPSPRTYEASLRSLVNYVLDVVIPGAALEAGADDADVTAMYSVTNLIPNTRAAVDIASWAAGDNASAPLRITSGPPSPPVGTTSIGWNPTAAGASNMIPAAGTNKYRVTPGKWYVFKFYGLCTTSRTSRAAIQWWTSGGQTLSSTDFGTAAGTGVNDWRERYVIAQAPPGADSAYPYMNTTGNGGSFAEAHYITMAMFYEGDELVPYFDGATSGTSAYTYAWSSTAHASTSTRTPSTERPRELFLWEAGVTAWEFLTPIVTMSGLRLWCDEQRRWQLIDPAAYIVPGRVVAQVSNSSEGTDTIDSLSSSYATGVVLVYTWTDTDGVAQRRIDAAGSGPFVIREEISKPFPGIGRAAARLLKLQGQGRTQEVTVGADFTVTPAMEIGIRLPGTFDQLGTLQRVTWQLKSALMGLGSIGLASTVPGSIDGLTGTIDGLTGTIDAL